MWACGDIPLLPAGLGAAAGMLGSVEVQRPVQETSITPLRS